MKLSPAEYVIKTIGGVRATGRAIGRKPSTICKWRKPRTEKGTGGKIPRKAAELILLYAKKHKLEIDAYDIIHGR